MKTVITLVAVIGMGLAFISSSKSEELKKYPNVKVTEEKAPGPAQTEFQPINIDPALIKQSMQARSEYEDLNRKIIARQTKLCDENATIKDLQVKMREIQKNIDKILAEDQELQKLHKKFQSVSPEMPIGMKRPVAGNAPLAPGTLSPAPAKKNP